MTRFRSSLASAFALALLLVALNAGIASADPGTGPDPNWSDPGLTTTGDTLFPDEPPGG